MHAPARADRGAANGVKRRSTARGWCGAIADRVSCIVRCGCGCGCRCRSWTVEQPAQVTACGQAALKGAACGISSPAVGGESNRAPECRAHALFNVSPLSPSRWRDRRTRNVRAATIASRATQTTGGARHILHIIAASCRQDRRDAHAPIRRSTVRRGFDRRRSLRGLPRAARSECAPCVARGRGFVRGRRHAPRSAIGEGRPGGGRRDTKTNRRAASFLAAEG